LYDCIGMHPFCTASVECILHPSAQTRCVDYEYQYGTCSLISMVVYV
jgi:hypothetical protein